MEDDEMDTTTLVNLDNLYSHDRQVQNQAFLAILAATEQPVDWAYLVWGDLEAALQHKDNHVRAIAAQVLCNLARSDPEQRMLKTLDALVAVTKDARFVTARHTLQALWKVGLAGTAQREKLLDELAYRFKECAVEKNATLIRYDILQGLRNLFDHTGDERARALALDLIDMETDLKYRKKYKTVWRNV
jgi:hypothetical protein